MELKEGMYVRTENGIIEKINKIYDRHATDNVVIWLNGYGDGRSVFIDDFEEVKYQSINARGFIKKEPSFNIIDLIEVGDYVNGRCVGRSVHNGFIKLEVYSYDDYGDDYLLVNEDIKSIVTKEQFESMSYKVGE